MNHNKHIQFLTGAPSAEIIENSSSKYIADFLPAFRRYLEPERRLQRSYNPDQSDSSNPKWRRISLTRPNIDYDQESSEAPPEREDTQPDSDEMPFLNYTFHAYTQSELDIPNSFEATDSYVEFIETQNQNTTFDSIVDEPLPTRAVLPANMLSTIKALPQTKELLSKAPRLAKVTLLAGVIQVLPTRTVTVRKTQQPMSIVEVILSDETSVGLSVNFWLSPEETSQLSRTVASVKSGDILVVRHIALHTYQGKVYGQSLNPKLRGVQTSLEVIGRKGVVVGEIIGSLESKRKLDRIKIWITRFLWKPQGGTKRKRTQDYDSLPPDSLPTR